MDVRDSATYVFCGGTYSGDGESGQRFWKGRFGTTHLEMDDSGKRMENTGLRTLWILDLMKKIALDLFFMP